VFRMLRMAKLKSEGGADAGELRRGLARTIESAGPYIRALYLRDGVWTRDDYRPADDFRLRWHLQLIADLAPKPISELRVLDLGCEEGMFGVEFARHGAEVVAVDGREAHVRRTSFLAEAVGVADRVDARVADVRYLDPDELGRFDLVLCLGLLYHLDRDDLAPFARLMAALSSWATLVQTQIALSPRERFEVDGLVYWGHSYFEHPPESGADEREAEMLASLTNPAAFWLTRPSLFNLLCDAGYTSVVEHGGPRSAVAHEDIISVLAVRGERQEVHFAPGASEHPAPRWDEHRRYPRHRIATRSGWLRDRLRRSRAGTFLRKLKR
jgi:SAM-dependent methyltransferase